MFSRRTFLKLSVTSAGTFLVGRFGGRAFAIPLPGGSLGPLSLPKYVTPLVIPPAMPRSARLRIPGISKSVDYYEIAVRQFAQQILPAGSPATTVWSYGSATAPAALHYPAFTIEAKWNQPVRVKWINGLVDGQGNYLSHLLPVDQTLHWANPPGGPDGTDTHTEDPSPYLGPVPIVTHVHGAHATDESDGDAEAWYLPTANDIPAGYATEGSWYETFKQEFLAEKGVEWTPGSATFQYANDQSAATLWYHDHTLGMTRLNVYAGPAGFYLLRGGPGDAVIGRFRVRRPRSATRRGSTTTRSRSRSRTAPFRPTARSSIRAHASSSTVSPDLTCPTATSRRSGTLSSSGTRWS